MISGKMLRRDFLLTAVSLPILGLSTGGVKRGSCNIISCRPKPLLLYQQCSILLAHSLFDKVQSYINEHPGTKITDIQIWDDPVLRRYRRWGWYGWIEVVNIKEKIDMASSVDVKMSTMSKIYSERVTRWTYIKLKSLIVKKYSDSIFAKLEPGERFCVES